MLIDILDHMLYKLIIEDGRPGVSAPENNINKIHEIVTVSAHQTSPLKCLFCKRKCLYHSHDDPHSP